MLMGMKMAVAMTTVGAVWHDDEKVVDMRVQ